MARWRLVTCALAATVVLGACGGGGGGGELQPIRATPSGRAVTGDDFAVNTLRWEEVDDDGLSVRIDIGTLSIETSRVGEPIVVVPGRIDADLFDTETAVTLRSDERERDAGELGVVCRSADGAFYAFTIDDTGTATIALWTRGVRTVLGSSTQSGEPRRLAGRCLGGAEGGEVELELILDGVVAVTATDATALASGPSGVFAMAASDTLTAAFDRFEVRELPDGTTHLPPPAPFGPLPEGGFTDDFAGDDGPFGELHVEDDLGGFLAEYDGGTYHLRADGFVQRSAPVDPVPDHAVAQVSVQRTSSGPSFRGLRWARDEDRYYEVAIDDGVAIIGYVDGDRDAYVELAREDGVGAIRGGDEVDVLRTELSRSNTAVHITLHVNDQLVVEADDVNRWGELHFSQVFMRSTEASTEPTDVRFDDYSLTAVSS